MKTILYVVFFSALLILSLLSSYAARPIQFEGKYIGEKMWNTRRTVSFRGSVYLVINDSTAIVSYPSSERVDTFIYLNNFNNGYRYTRRQNKFRYEHLILSKDSTKLQIGEPMEQNFFYKLINKY